ncbi:MAG: PIG-L family deacetylase [Chlorobi bacterium]|nr:PIG-L family deacetylase [Chlorobiota bacterium]MCI0715876.1 PIG-L family deacetylase [Chlorobiota bacterium]
MYIFPHPDDESSGSAHAISSQQSNVHDVYLLTLTKGGTTKQRHKFGYSVEEKGEVRYKEMLDAEKVLNLSGIAVLDLPG